MIEILLLTVIFSAVLLLVAYCVSAIVLTVLALAWCLFIVVANYFGVKE